MKLVGFGFTGNGVLKGTLPAVDDAGEPLGWEVNGNWSNVTLQELAIRQLAVAAGIGVEKSRALYFPRHQAGKTAGRNPESWRYLAPNSGK